MIKKLISGGQTGADRAALDVAIGLGFPHGGWIPKGRLTEAEPLPAKYRLEEIADTSYTTRTEKNVMESDGTLILSHGSLTGGSDLARNLTISNQKPCLHIDLDDHSDLLAAKKIGSWVANHEIAILYVTGPRASKDPDIYNAARKVLETFFHVAFMEWNLPNPRLFSPLRKVAFEITPDVELKKKAPAALELPKTLDEAVAFLLSQLSSKQKMKIARLSEEGLMALRPSLGVYITDKFKLWGNEALVESCRRFSETTDMDPDQASVIIITEVWEKLQDKGPSDDDG